MDATELLSRFKGLQEDADGYVVCCPAHADGRPSLKIWFDDTKCRMVCRAGCKTVDVLTAAGLRWKDLFSVTGERTTVSAKQAEMVAGAPVVQLRLYVQQKAAAFPESPAAEYAARRFGITTELAADLRLGYDEGQGFAHTSAGFTRFPRLTVPLYDFRGIALGLQGRDLSGLCPGRWLSLRNPEGLRWLPYGVFRPDADAFVVCEGPGDALTAVAADPSIGAVIIRGASLAKNAELLAEVAGALRGRRVILAGDNDKAGREFVKNAAEGLRNHALIPSRLAIPVRANDVSEWREKDPQFTEHFRHAAAVAEPIPAKTNNAQTRRMAQRWR